MPLDTGRLKSLKKLVDDGILTEEEFAEQKAELIQQSKAEGAQPPQDLAAPRQRPSIAPGAKIRKSSLKGGAGTTVKVERDLYTIQSLLYEGNSILWLVANVNDKKGEQLVLKECIGDALGLVGGYDAEIEVRKAVGWRNIPRLVGRTPHDQPTKTQIRTQMIYDPVR